MGKVQHLSNMHKFMLKFGPSVFKCSHHQGAILCGGGILVQHSTSIPPLPPKHFHPSKTGASFLHN